MKRIEPDFFAVRFTTQYDRILVGHAAMRTGIETIGRFYGFLIVDASKESLTSSRSNWCLLPISSISHAWKLNGIVE